jgi:aconitate hydratase
MKLTLKARSELTFANEADYDKIQEDDTINLWFSRFCSLENLSVEFVQKMDSKRCYSSNHTYNAGQIGWYVAGSALNLIAAEA